MRRERIQVAASRWDVCLQARPLLLTTLVAAAFASCAVDDRSLSDNSSGTGGYAGSLSSSGNGGSAVADAGAPVGGAPGPAGAPGASGNAAGGDPNPPLEQCADLDENSVPDCDETLVKNSTFDRDAGDWVSEDNVNQKWVEDDADEREGSGSLGIVNFNYADIPNLSIGGSKQCVPISGGGWYDFRANVLIAKGQGSKGSAGFSALFFESADCSGKQMPNFGGTSQLIEQQGEWLPLRFQTEAPSNSSSMSVEVVVVKGFKESALTVLFDNLLVKPLEP